MTQYNTQYCNVSAYQKQINRRKIQDAVKKYDNLLEQMNRCFDMLNEYYEKLNFSQLEHILSSAKQISHELKKLIERYPTIDSYHKASFQNTIDETAYSITNISEKIKTWEVVDR